MDNFQVYLGFFRLVSVRVFQLVLEMCAFCSIFKSKNEKHRFVIGIGVHISDVL